MAEQSSTNQSAVGSSSSASIPSHTSPAGATDDGEEWTTVARPNNQRNDAGNRGAQGTKRPYQQSAPSQSFQQNNWRDSNGASTWNRASNSKPNSSNQPNPYQQQRQPQHFQPGFNRPQGQQQQQQPMRWGGGSNNYANNNGGGNFQRGNGSQQSPVQQNSQQNQGSNAEQLDPKPFAQALYDLVNRNAHGASEKINASAAVSVASADSSSPSPSAGGAAGSFQSAVPPYLASYIRNFSPFVSNNPLLSPSTFASGWPAARFATHTIRGFVYRNQSMQAHGSIAIYQIDGVILEKPIFIWGNMEMNRPQKRFDSPAMVDFNTFLTSPSSAAAAPASYRYHLYKPQNGRLYTIFKYAVNGVDFPCIKSLGNSPFWKIDSAVPENGNTVSPSPNQQRGFAPPSAQSDNTGIVLDAPSERLFAHLRELKLIPIPPVSNAPAARSFTPSSAASPKAPAAVDSVNSSPPPPPLTLARSQSGQIRYSAPLAPWASPMLAKANSPPINSSSPATAQTSAATTSTSSAASVATVKPTVVKSALNPAATAWGPSAARVFPSSTPPSTANAVASSAATTAVSSSPAPPALRSAFDQLWLDPSFQSLTFEWSGNNMGPDQSDNVMVTPSYSNRITPLFFQTRAGETILFDSTFPSNASVSSQENEFGGEFRAENLDQLQQKLKAILDKAQVANEAHREKRHMILEEEPQHFVDIGRFLFFTPSVTAASACASTITSGKVVNRMGFSLLPNDYERASNECRFSPSLQVAIRDALASLKSDGSLGRVHLTGMWPAWLLKELQRRVLARGISYGRYSAVRLNAEAFAKTIATFQPLPASSNSGSSTDASNSKKPKRIQRMLILVAFPGAGKSYFSERLLSVARAEQEAFVDQQSAAQSAAETSSTYELDENAVNTARPIQWVRINQDTMGSRRNCELAAERALNAGSSVIIDRTNIDYSQRSNWVNMARKFRLDEVECVLLNMPVNICKQRVLDRVNHETLPSTNASLSIVDRFLANYAPPVVEEGFTRMHQIDYFEDEAVRESKMTQMVQDCNRRR